MARTLVAGIIVIGAIGIQAQTPAPAAATAPAAPLAISGQLQGQYAGIKNNLTRLADKMPDDQYGFKPSPDMRSFAQSVAHTAAANFSMCANLTGKPNPISGTDLEKTIATKADATKALRESFAFCDEYMQHLSAEALAATYQATAVRGGERTPIAVERGGLAANLVEHGNEMYGYLSVYLRLKGLVPPTSEPRPGPGRGGR